jgi:hypothetical protein
VRLIDQLVQSPVSQILCDDRGNRFALDAPAGTIARAERAPLRYVIDDRASRQCCDLIRGPSAADLLDPENPLLRLPEGTTWMEWREEPEPLHPGDRLSLRVSVLAEVEPGGRRGRLCGFFENSDSTLAMFPGHLDFDLDADRCDRDNAMIMRQQDLPALNALLRRADLGIDMRWRSFCRSRGIDLREVLASQANYFWYLFPFIFSFAALLNTPGVMHEQPAELARINRARMKGGKRPLMDHIEVSMVLGERRASEEGAGESGAGERQPPRLHFVRGHPVNRGGKTFWRTSHFRGDFDQPILSRTVRVKAAGSGPHNHAESAG